LRKVYRYRDPIGLGREPPDDIRTKEPPTGKEAAMQEILELEQTIADKEREAEALAARRRELEARLESLLGKQQHAAV
jgi:hypothetical protein